ncbi:uncharacterized protein F5147DRAFT_378989 [Suillus discolor]|uniref:Uncharacterized protein n=1 Tax=Suillus discolor TaxID=1912936 RepID=A0A9P7JKE1_9AGAM|nr:uncharacterized protein F5147DRAFT_378989 [Suillus discolor]KAG2079662.1 hypothetical protein F5147DRAFT_378989 [Suillus discolor]
MESSSSPAAPTATFTHEVFLLSSKKPAFHQILLMLYRNLLQRSKVLVRYSRVFDDALREANLRTRLSQSHGLHNHLRLPYVMVDAQNLFWKNDEDENMHPALLNKKDAFCVRCDLDRSTFLISTSRGRDWRRTVCHTRSIRSGEPSGTSPLALTVLFLSEPFRTFVTAAAISPVGRYSEFFMRRGDSGGRNVLLVFTSVPP